MLTSLQPLQHAIQSGWAQSPIWRRAWCTALAVMMAVFVDRYASLSHESWVILATLLVMQMTLRSHLHQDIVRLIVMIVAVVIGIVITSRLPIAVYTDSLLVVLFIVCCFIQAYFPSKALGFAPLYSAAWLILISLAPFTLSGMGHLAFDRLHDVIQGGAIGVIASLIILPSQPDFDFRRGLIPVLRAYGEYLDAITALIFQTEGSATLVNHKKVFIEKALQSRQVFFPVWVYEKGFNPRLRAGHRHFLMRVEQMSQVLFALNYTAQYSSIADLLAPFRQPIETCVADFSLLLTDFIGILEHAETAGMNTQFADDMVFLENNFHTEVQLPFELLETSPEYMQAMSFIYGLKDLQAITAKLQESLRAYLAP